MGMSIYQSWKCQFPLPLNDLVILRYIGMFWECTDSVSCNLNVFRFNRFPIFTGNINIFNQ